MWGGFVKWCQSQNPPVSLSQITTEDLLAFQASRAGATPTSAPSPRYAHRLLRLVDRVLVHNAVRGSRSKNHAAEQAINSQPEVRYAGAAGNNELPNALEAAEAKALVSFLSRARPRLGLSAADLTWQQLRNRTSVALQLGAGLTPSDVRSLTSASPIIAGGRVQGRPWKVRVPASGSAPERETPLATWAAELLQHWLRVREEQQLPGAWLFPSTKGGKPWGKTAQYLATKSVLQEAGIKDEEGGSFRLRHTFALRQLRHGADPDQVAAWLGVVDPKVIARYRRMIASPQDVI